MEINVRGETVVLTQDTIDATWASMADLCRKCADGALAGDFFTNDPEGYAAEQRELADRYDAHDGRMTMSFIQQAVFIQTGQSVPILP